MTDKDKQDIPPESTNTSERREEAGASDMSDVTLTEADLKVDEPEASSTAASNTDPAAETVASNPQQDNAQADALPSMKASQTAAPETTKPDDKDKAKKDSKSKDAETADGDADKWAHLSAQEAKLLEYLKKHFGDGITSAPRLTKEYLQETARNYHVKEALIPSVSLGKQYGLSAGTKLVFTNKDKNSGSSFTLKKERDNSVSSVFTGDRKNFANYVDTWSKNLLIAQRGPMTVTLTSGTAEEKFLMKLSLEAQSKPGAEITVEGFDENTLDTKQKREAKQKWEAARGTAQTAQPVADKTASQKVVETAEAQEKQPTHRPAHDGMVKESSQLATVDIKPGDEFGGGALLSEDVINGAAQKPQPEKAASQSRGGDTPPPPATLKQQPQQAAADKKQAWGPSNKSALSFSRPVTGKNIDLPRGITIEAFTRAKDHIIASGKASASELTKQFGMTDTKARAILDKLEEQGVLTPRKVSAGQKKATGRQPEMA